MRTFSLRKSTVPLWFTLIMLGFLGFVATLPDNTEPVIASIILSSLALLFILFCYRSQTSRIVLTSSELRIFGDLTNFKTKLEHLQLEQAQILNLQLESGLYPAFRTFGTQIPPYNTGYFTLSNDHKAFVFITNQARVVHIPAKQGEDLLLSLEQPEEFITALNAATREFKENS